MNVVGIWKASLVLALFAASFAADAGAQSSQCTGCKSTHKRPAVSPDPHWGSCSLSLTVTIGDYDGVCIDYQGQCYPLLCSPSLRVTGECGWSPSCGGGFTSTGSVCTTLWGPAQHDCAAHAVDVYSAILPIECGEHCDWSFTLRGWAQSSASVTTASGTLECSSCQVEGSIR